ncbi:MAG: peptide deformylase [Bacilli bacterium]|nr:peptide deformylase [Bacilli bacterium]
MLKTTDILDERDKRLRKVSAEVKFPLTKDDLNNIEKMIEYLKNSQIEELSLKYDLRPGMGLSACQLGVNKRYFVIVHEQEDGSFKEYIIINPEIVSYSDELIYACDGEGCLSVNRDVEGIIPRYARVTVKARDLNNKEISIRAREELAIAFQHEMDHLNGILFFDKIDKDNPFKNNDKMRPL